MLWDPLMSHSPSADRPARRAFGCPCIWSSVRKERHCALRLVAWVAQRSEVVVGVVSADPIGLQCVRFRATWLSRTRRSDCRRESGCASSSTGDWLGAHDVAAAGDAVERPSGDCRCGPAWPTAGRPCVERQSLAVSVGLDRLPDRGGSGRSGYPEATSCRTPSGRIGWLSRRGQALGALQRFGGRLIVDTQIVSHRRPNRLSRPARISLRRNDFRADQAQPRTLERRPRTAP